VLFNSQGIKIIQSNTLFFIVKIHLYIGVHVSAPRSRRQASTVRTDPNLIFVQLGSQEFTVLKYNAKLKLLGLK
jgi:hypothetical protein